ncbi:MAG TPA: hypothetical protein VLJ37_12300 [bacterium]|nr:hypothetical protein [bacterium]
MLDQKRVLESFRTALAELKEANRQGDVSLTLIADLAREVFCRNLPVGVKKPSIWTFRARLLGRRVDAEILSLIEGHRIPKLARIDRSKMIEAFERAIEEDEAESGRSPRPRTIAVRAHRLFCEDLPSGTKPPALVSFTQRVTGKTADPVILSLLEKAGIDRVPHASLCRERLRQAFDECIKRLESRILKGVARPLHVADSAHRIYTDRSPASEPKPSLLTFRRLVYGQGADPEIASLLQPHFHHKK